MLYFGGLSERDFKNVTIEKNDYGYFLIINLQNNFNSNRLVQDSQIAGFLGLSISRYIEMLKKFNIYKNNAGIFFEFLEDAENAKNWLNENTISLLTLKNLIQ